MTGGVQRPASKMDIALAVLPLLPSAWAMYMAPYNDMKLRLYISLLISTGGYLLTSALVPVISEYTLRRGMCGKDLGKKGSPDESKDVPEALGIVSGTVFLICTIASQLIFARNDQDLVIYNSALFSICFMIFLGFTDDTLDLKWRYKLILPTIASLPLLSTYSGSTAVYVPLPFRGLFMSEGKLTTLGAIIDLFATVDTVANGAIIELGYLFLVFMGLLAVFCTNSINILAGINGLECGQSYIIACSILFFKLYELQLGDNASVAADGVYTGSSISSQSRSLGCASSEHRVFALLLIIPFIGASLGLLQYNWYPSRVFVGDTFCYFAGMTFAVVGIHGHFSKTLLMLFLPQVINFLYSIPQLFKLVPCPRHRLPRVDPASSLLYPSTFPCASTQYTWFKVRKDDVECPNFTILCGILRLFGPMRERTLTIVILIIQALSAALAFFIRYIALESPEFNARRN